ncbi:DPP IV N-terminal domain-containing protein [bacterium SCSIO 12741]|nr:DPP IV N-terminal domain-containing protein [bacterium SCSIO 12741]
MRHFVMALALFACVLSSVAQKKDLTLDQSIIGQWTTFRAQTPKQLHWIEGSDNYSWITLEDSVTVLKMAAANSKEESTLLSFDDLKKADGLAELKRFPRLMKHTKEAIWFVHQQQLMQYTFADKSVKSLLAIPKNAENADWNVDHSALAYTLDNNLYYTEANKPYQITNEGEGIVCGQAVHRLEFGIHKGTFWSPDGSQLAFYRKDESRVTLYPLMSINEVPATDASVRYPMAGQTSHEVTVSIFNRETKGEVLIKTGQPLQQYLTNIAWSPDGKSLYIGVLNRDQNHLKMNRYNAATGEFEKTVFEERHEKYVQPLHPIEFIPGNAEQFIWQSERDGYNHLYLYNTDGKMLRQITKGEWVVTDVHGFDASGNVLFTRTANNGMDRLPARASLKGSVTLLSEESGVHTSKFSTSGAYLIDYFTSLSTPMDVNLINAKGKTLKTLSSSPDLMADYNMARPELGTLEAADGSVLNYRIIKPSNFDPSKKYRSLVYVYNGPGVQLLTNRWWAGASLWMNYLAEKGYVVFTVDGRGTENRGREFEQQTFRMLGELEVADQLRGVDFLKSQSWIDPDRMAVHGWSYGGFMTTSLMLKAPGIFKVGVAGGPVIDWSFYEVMYTERYMDIPEANIDGYARASLIDKIGNLQGDLLLIHGMDDDVVVPQHSFALLKSAVDNGVQVDFFIYPGHKHNVRGKDRIHLMDKVIRYIDEKLDRVQ